MSLPEIDRLWNYQDPAETERRFREVVPLAEKAGDTAYQLELLTQIARAVCLQRKFEAAHAILDKVHEQLADNMARPKVRYLLERGRILNDTRRREDALRVFQEAWELANHIGDRLLAADALHMLAYVSEGEEGLRWHRIAIDFCENSEGERFRRWLCSLYMNAADKYEEMHDYRGGKECVRRSLSVAEELGLNDRARDAKCFLARLERLSGDVPKAMALLEPLLASDAPRGYVFEEFAECLLATGCEELARTNFARAYELLAGDPWYPPTEVERLERIRRLGAGT